MQFVKFRSCDEREFLPCLRQGSQATGPRTFGSSCEPVKALTRWRNLDIVTSPPTPYVAFANAICSLGNFFVVFIVSRRLLPASKRRAYGTQVALLTGSNQDPRRTMAMFRLDYLSCFLTIVATILVGRKMWTGLVVSGVNSLIVCVIGLHTSQYGFIPANVFCICINAFNLRAWLKVQKDPSESTTDASSELVAGCKRMSTSKKAAPRRLINSFRIRSEGRLGNSISSLAVKGVWPFAPTPPSYQHKRLGAPPLTHNPVNSLRES